LKIKNHFVIVVSIFLLLMIYSSCNSSCNKVTSSTDHTENATGTETMVTTPTVTNTFANTATITNTFTNTFTSTITSTITNTFTSTITSTITDIPTATSTAAETCGIPGTPVPSRTELSTDVTFGHKTDITQDTQWTTNYMGVTAFTPTYDYRLWYVEVQVKAAGGIRVAIYLDANGSNVPGHIVAVSSPFTATGEGWVSLCLPDITLVGGEKYWIGAISQTGPIGLSNVYTGEAGYYAQSTCVNSVPGNDAVWTSNTGSNMVYLHGSYIRQ